MATRKRIPRREPDVAPRQEPDTASRIVRLGGRSVVPALRADVEADRPADGEIPYLVPQATYYLKEFEELSIKIDYDGKAGVIRISACR